LLIKLVEVMASSIGTATRSWFKIRDARAEAFGKVEAARIERLGQEQIRQEMKDIRAGRKTITGPELKVIDVKVEGKEGELQRVKSDYVKALQATFASPAQLIELKRRINLDQITSMVIEEAEAHSGGEPDDKPIEPDWFVQWRNRGRIERGYAASMGSGTQGPGCSLRLV